MSTPVAAHASAASPKNECRVSAAQPYLDAKGMIRGTGLRSGCDDNALLRVRIKQARRGPDRTLKSASKRLANGSITVGLRCTDTPRTYYVQVLDYRGHIRNSAAARLACGPSTGTPSPSPSPSASPTAAPSPTGSAPGSSVEEEVVRLTNAARAQNGCGPLTHDPKLQAAAEGHSADMAAKGYFDHTSPDGRNPGDRIKAAGFSPISAWGENIAKGYGTAAAVVDGWLKSPGHRANILNCNFTHIGVGHVTSGPHWTQVFARH
ncbi:CAP domain-containing protein [Thermoactinospora rubra]|uniref:CAP domain-containing protein n=1 Tax=Thermoactinospora rubra TaxID=1088767 RepID=UPI000A0F6E50|nr:CAP domain-containing protein [Thermoactinospora rubra]